MGAFISIAFVTVGTLREQLARPAAAALGFVPREEAREGDEMAEIQGTLPLMGQRLPATWRLYAREGWVAHTVDVSEEVYSALGVEVGRTLLADELYALATQLMELAVERVVVGLEVEAERGDTGRAPLVLQRSEPGESNGAEVTRYPWGWALRYGDDPDPMG